MANKFVVVATEGELTVVTFLEASLGQSSAEGLRKELMTLAASPPSRFIVLLGRGMKIISAEMLGIMVVFEKAVKARGCGVGLAELPKLVQQVFQVSGLDSVFAIGATAQETMEKMRPAAESE